MALAEKNGVDRERVMSILSSSIFDCLIYKVRLRWCLVTVKALMLRCG
jgi:3-hydroxyisobutyrate dehydrogenase-like beta-hydroxyacid dehydrogenase